MLLVLSVFDLFTRAPTNETGGTVDVGLFGSPGLAILFSIAVAVVILLLVYYICEGITEMAEGTGELAALAKSRWLFFLWTEIATAALIVVAFASTEALVVLALAAIIANLVAAILIAGLLRRADRVFYPRAS